MKTALVADRLGPLAGSNITDVASAPLAGALAALGHQVTLYACDLDIDDPPGVEVIRVRGACARPESETLRRLPECSALLARRWSAEPPDVVHAMSWTAGLTSLAALRDTRTDGRPIPLVQTFDRLSLADGGGRARMEAAIARSAALVVARSFEEVTELTRLGLPRASVTVVPCGVDLDRYTPEGPAAPRTAQQRVIAFGPLDGAAVDLAVRGLRRALQAELVIVGGSAPEERGTGPGTRRLRAAATRGRVQERVRQVGAVPEAELPALLRSAEAAVFPAPDRCGAGALAAMACGVPVLAVAAGALADMVVEGATGDLVPPGEPETFAAALHDLLESPMTLAGYRIGAADRARARYGWDRIAADTEAVYQRALHPDTAAVG